MLCLAALLPSAAFSQVVERTDTLRAARVTSDKVEIDRSATQTGLQRLDASKLNRGFALFNSPDVIKTLQSLPGVASGTELASGMYVHGGDGTDNLFLLDGVPIYQVSHMIGLFSAFNSDLVESVDFYKSGFPARYGGRGSSVVDVRMRDGNFEKAHGGFSIGLIDGRLFSEGPIGKSGRTSYIVGVRRTWLDLLTRPALAIVNARQRKKYGFDNSEEVAASYNFTDFNARLTHRFENDGTLRASFCMSRDFLPVDYHDRFNYYDESDGRVWKDNTHVGMDLDWGNILGSLSYGKDFSKTLHGEAMAYLSRNIGDITLGFTEEDEKAGTRQSISEGVTAHVVDAGIKASGVWRPAAGQTLRFGAQASRTTYTPSRYSEIHITASPLDTLLKEGGSTGFSAVQAAAFAEDEFDLLPFLKVNAGLRYSLFSSGGKTWHSLEPRLALKAQCGRTTSVKMSYAEMSQPEHKIATSYLDLPTNTWLPSTSVIRPMRTRELAGGVYSEVQKGFNVSLEGWYKTMDNLYEYCGSNLLYPAVEKWESEFIPGKGRSWGAEVSLEYETERLFTSLYYTLGWSQRYFSEIWRDWYPDRNDNRHKITVSASYHFTKRLDGYIAWNWHSGSYITAGTYLKRFDGATDTGWGQVGDEVYDRPNNLQLPSYHRLDVGLNFNKKTRRGNEACWNLSVYNAYNRMNAIFAYLGDEEKWDASKNCYVYTGRKVGKAVGLVPVIPTFGYTLKF